MLINLDLGYDNFNVGGITFSVAEVEGLINQGIRIIIILILMYLTIKIGKRIIDKFVERQIKSNARFSMDNQKAKTIGGVLKSVLRYVTYFSGLALILADFFGGMSVAMASVGGVALGFGAQSLVKDVINGFFILFEDHYGVGDHVTIGNFTGIVETIGIRTTSIRDFTGDLHLIPNGTITTVTNHSRGNIKFIVDVEVSYEENIDNVIGIISEVTKKFEERNEDITSPIEVLGVNSVNPSKSSMIIRVSGGSKPLKQWSMERKLRKEIKGAFDEKGIKVPQLITEPIIKKEDKYDR
ncbi:MULTISPECIES: mechanosensitive ion channel family protein [Clostridium]|uniref:Mechanosensitive ion channel family protein n=1 Tax=Clostridium cibarium TaxID=2762247 RepID=A0ABR8PY84_9CLOT|nr:MULTISPECIES: mechanosensitive ion channel family protein [Clostridium]MBD7913102.1 mechanosensitive ion channel family protein [Clostridium cibarium]